MHRFLYHALSADTPSDQICEPPSLRSEGFIHCSFASDLRESVRLYMAHVPAIDVLCIDPTKLAETVLRVEATPRGGMPHLFGKIPPDAIVWRKPFSALPEPLSDEMP